MAPLPEPLLTEVRAAHDATKDAGGLLPFDEQTEQFLYAVWDGFVGLVWVATNDRGRDGTFNDGQPLSWPAQSREILDRIRERRELGDVWITTCVLDPDATNRGKRFARGSSWASADLDGQHVSPSWAHRHRAMVVASGSPGSFHVWPKLCRKVDAAERLELCQGLVTGLGADRAPVQGNAYLRPPGTYNYKQVPAGGRRRQVEMLLPPPRVGIDPAQLPQPSARPSTRHEDERREFTPEQADAYLDRALDELRAAPLRNNGLNARAMEFGHFVPHHLSADEATARLRGVAEQIGLDDGEIGPTIASGLTAGRKSWTATIIESDGSGDGDPAPCLPGEFWERRAVLDHIRQFARAESVAADALLGAVLARLSAMCSHELRLRNCIGDGSLNLFAALVGPSGSGKSTAAKGAGMMLGVPLFLSGLAADGGDLFAEVTPSTGEGLVEALFGEITEVGADGKRTSRRQQVRHNLFGYLDEGESFGKLVNREGSILGPTVRSAWVGAQLGSANASKDRKRSLKSGTYSMGLLIGFQEHTALELLRDVNAGTPQRFLWLSSELRVLLTRHERPPRPEPLPDLVGYDEIRGLVGPVTFEDEVEDEVDRCFLAARSASGTDDSHEPLMLSKLAALFALLDRRRVGNLEDWRLARMLWATSCAVRDRTARYGDRQAADLARRRVEARVQEAERSPALRASVTERLAAKIARYVCRKFDETGEPVRRKAARDLINKRDREQWPHLLEPAERLMFDQRWLAEEGERWVPGAARDDIPEGS